MGKPKRNKKTGRYDERLSRSSQPWETGRGAPRKGNPRYKPVKRGGKKTYVKR